jgi:hypothetical protein
VVGEDVVELILGHMGRVSGYKWAVKEIIWVERRPFG